MTDALQTKALADTWMTDAGTALARGNLQKAEMLARSTLDVLPTDARAHMTLAQIAQLIGASDMAGPHLAAAWSAGALNTGLARVTLPPALPPDTTAGRTRYLLIKAWGYGFWSDMDHVLGQLLLAEITDRVPVVHWGANSLFREADTANAFDSFFQPVSGTTLHELQADGLSYFPDKWTRDNLSADDHQKWSGPGSRITGLYALRRPEDVVVSDFHTKVNDLLPWIPPAHPLHGMSREQVYRHLVMKYLRLQPRLQQLIDAHWQRQLAGRHWLAVHVRGSDKALEMKHLDELNRSYWPNIDRILEVNPSLSIFLLTDSAPMVAEFTARYGDRITCLDCQRSDNQTGVHYAGHSGTELGEQVIVDAYLAARCDFFLGNGGSNVSVAIRHLKSWAPGTFFLIGADFLAQRNLMLHDW